jgi:CMP-N-acetylneuraminic acid synthetase
MILIVIPAKGGSSRLPNKNMAILNGRPMLDYAVLQARMSKRADRIVISTDDDAIAARAKELGVETVRRSTALGGDVPLYDVYKHAAEQVGIDEIDILIGLQADHPDRNVGVDEALAFFEKSGGDMLTTTEANGTKNGSYKIYNRTMLLSGVPQNEVTLVDDCTNVHYQEDLEKASKILSQRAGA